MNTQKKKKNEQNKRADNQQEITTNKNILT